MVFEIQNMNIIWQHKPELVCCSNENTSAKTKSIGWVKLITKSPNATFFLLSYTYFGQHYTTCLWRQPGFFQVEVKGLKMNTHQSSRVSLVHIVDSLTESSGWASRDSILTKQITIWHKAPTATHICLAVLKNRAETPRLQSTLRHNKVWHYIYPDIFFPQTRNPKLFSALSDIKKTVAYDIQTFCFSSALAFFSYWRKLCRSCVLISHPHTWLM